MSLATILDIIVTPGVTLKYLEAVAETVYFRDWEPKLQEKGDGFLFFWEIPVGAKKWNTRKWYISTHSCESEIIQTMLAAALAGVEHEGREDFKVNGKVLYGPHINHRALAVVAEDLEIRA